MDAMKELFGESLQDFEIQNQQEDWIKLETQLIKKEFYKFNFFRFNLYYALLMGALTAINIFFLGDYILNKMEQKDRITIVETSSEIKLTVPEINSKENRIIDAKVNDIYEESHKSKADFKNGSNSKNTEVTKKLNSDKKEIGIPAKKLNTLENLIAVDSFNTESESIKDLDTFKIKKPEPIYITKRDTIIKIDSVKVKARRYKNHNK